MASAHGLARAHAHCHLPAFAARAIASQPEEFDRQVEALARQGAGQIGGKDKGADQHRHENFGTRGRGGDRARQRGHAGFDVAFGIENLRGGHPLASANSSVRWRAPSGGLDRRVWKLALWPACSTVMSGVKSQ